jgi:hypothetical protein
MTVEDFTTYTKVDANNHIGLVGTNHVDFQDYRNEDAYLYKDKGTEHFTDFTHLLDGRINSHSGNNLAYIWMLSNDVDDVKGLSDAHKNFIIVRFYYYSGFYFSIEEFYWDGSTEQEYNAYHSATAGTWYYLKIIKSGTSLKAEAYSDAARTNKLWECSLTLHDSGSKRYIFVCNTWNSGSAYYGDEDIENLDLQEGGGQTYNVYVDAISQTLSFPAHQTGYSIARDASVSSQVDKTPETTFNISQDAITQALASAIIEVVAGMIEIFKDAIASAQAVFNCESTFNICNDAVIVAVSLPLIESVFGISSDAVVRVLAEVSVAKEGEVKVTRLFLVLGDLAVQLTGD